jgi:hypothetical protein
MWLVAAGVARIVEHLLSKCEALNSDPNAAQKKQNKKCNLY